MRLTCLMRHGTAAQILLILAQNGPTLHRDIASSLNISSQALTWQMNQLKTAGLISAEKIGVNVLYSFANPDTAQAIFNLNEQLNLE
jgi:predicted transcriptional regulator